jgi:hypothetical protein
MMSFLSLNNSRLGDFVDRINPIELEIKNTTYTDRAASNLDLSGFPSERRGAQFAPIGMPTLYKNIFKSKCPY